VSLKRRFNKKRGVKIMLNSPDNPFDIRFKDGSKALSRKVVIAAILGVALVAFEIFNFDTTQYALSNLLGEVRFAGVMWATILAVAFCAIDFAGLVRIFTPERGGAEPRAVWYLIGAWFLGTIANSVLTWWAVSLTLLSHEFGNEVLSREALLRYVPIFVAMLVWLTRILFIGAFSATGEDAFALARNSNKDKEQLPVARQAAPRSLPERPADQPHATQPVAATTRPRPAVQQPKRPAAPPSRPPITYEPVDDPVEQVPVMANKAEPAPSRPNSRIRQRPPMPGGGNRPVAPGGMRASAPKRND
jgi:hypothetical protein